MLSWPLSRVLGCDYFAKCENLQPVGAFKIRGGVNLLGSFSDAERRAGQAPAITASRLRSRGGCSACASSFTRQSRAQTR
jgi:threonine dehydratase